MRGRRAAGAVECNACGDVSVCISYERSLMHALPVHFTMVSYSGSFTMRRLVQFIGRMEFPNVTRLCDIVARNYSDSDQTVFSAGASVVTSLSPAS